MKKMLFYTVLLLIPLYSYQINAYASTKSREEYEKLGMLFGI
ncbi:hypothetical protein J2S10_004245 [Neobacillus ginsengisoli]|uniref:Uncharacterized protein n=1 Tax=Neobacillus ginsengisoli TaxID=904295 RepID=A0ABT9XZX0_9BACI|nr:hypothetical protein [Neobacillus ginsengisoli]